MAALAVWCAFSVLCWPPAALARPPHQSDGDQGRPEGAHYYKPGDQGRPDGPKYYKPGDQGRPDKPTRHNPPGPGYNQRVDRLPQGYHPVKAGRDNYYYYGGRYYRPHNHGYVVVRPPVGVWVPSLPPGYVSVVIGAMTYFAFMGVFYERTPTGYVVVAPPAPATIAPPAVGGAVFGTVTVMASSLNVRGGPSHNQVVILVLNQGEVLSVVGSVPGWLYVVLPNGQYGWVDQNYTTPIVPAVAPPAG